MNQRTEEERKEDLRREKFLTGFEAFARHITRRKGGNRIEK